MKLQVVKTNKGYVAVSDENIKENDWYFNPFIKVFHKHQVEKGIFGPILGSNKIIATDTSFKLEGIPQFELEKVEDVDTFVKSCLNEWGLVDTEPHNDLEKGRRIGLKIGLFYGYKAAQEKGCYTEEDLRKAINNVFNIVFKNRLLIKEDLKRITYDIINSLKQPKQLVGIEVETNSPYFDTEHQEERERNPSEIKPLINKSEDYPNGLLTIKQYFYK